MKIKWTLYFLIMKNEWKMAWFREWDREWSVQEVSSVSGTLRRCSGGLLWEWVGVVRIPGGVSPPPGSGWCPGNWCATIQVDTSDGTVGASLPPWRFPNLWHDLCQLRFLQGPTGPGSHLSRLICALSFYAQVFLLFSQCRPSHSRHMESCRPLLPVGSVSKSSGAGCIRWSFQQGVKSPLLPIFALCCHLTPYYLLEGLKCHHMLGLQVELELSSLEELVVFQFPDLPNILRYARDQEPSACPLSYLPAIFSFCMYFIFILFITITTFHMLSFFPPNRVYLNVPIFVTSHYWWWP